MHQPASKTRVLVVGAGAAGMACAWSLGRHRDRFAVEVWDGAPGPGGVATTEVLPDGRFINDGVQAAMPSYANLIRLHAALGFVSEPVKIRIRFGQGEDAWSNVADSALVQALRPEIARFATTLRWIARLEPLSVVVPIAPLLRLLGYSRRFIDSMVLPLVALFFGTGNRTPQVSAAIIARVFLDPTQRLFELDPERLLASEPTILPLPRLSTVYAALAADSGATFHAGRKVRSIERDDAGITAIAEDGTTARFDELVMACDAETSARVLDATRLERFVLSRVRYYDDVTVTHTDLHYMQLHYDLDPERDQYLVHFSPDAPDRIEMSFVPTAYQPQLRGTPPFFQTIFLDRRDESRWTKGDLDPSLVLFEKPWRQFAHEWRHFAFAVPLVRFIQARRRTRFAGAWTLVNTHEVATCSGFAAAASLGAPHPFAEDEAARASFDLYQRVAYPAFARG